MKKALFYITEVIVIAILVLWMCFTLNYYHTIDLGISFLPKIDWNLASNTNLDIISNVPGFVTVADTGATLLILGVGGLTLYFGLMLAFYFTDSVSKTAVFCMNVVFYAIFLIAIILGLLFINLDL